ncbi:MAG: TolC family protein [Betaproteobacteria bacterium]
MNAPMTPGFPWQRCSAFAVVLMLAGCASLTPTPFSDQEIRERVAADRREMYLDQEAITRPITFHEAAARALKYNLDFRLKLMETALAQGLHDVSRWDMMPRLLVGAGYVTRDNDSGGRSVGILNGIETLSPSTSQERSRRLSNVELSWNLLDFGVSYYRAQQKADQYLMAEERRRKVVQNVLQDVRNAYWRALGSQRLISRVDGLLSRVHTALERSRQAEKQGLLPTPTALAYQRALLDAVTLLSLRRQDLELARAELMALLSIPPGTEFSLAEAKEQALPPVPANMAELENMALERRPEIMEEWYRKRVTSNDIKAAMVLTLPGIQFDFFNAQYDSNKYLHNNAWTDSGIRLSWNLFRLASRPALERAHEAQNRTDDHRRMALAMAVLTQVRIGAQRYALARADLDVAEESARVDDRLLAYAKAAATTRVDSELEVIRAEARQLLAEYQRHATYSNAQAAWGRLYNSIGLDVLPEEISSHDIATVAQSIERTLKEWESVTFKSVSGPRRGSLSLDITLGALPAGIDRDALLGSVSRALLRHDIFMTASNPHRLDLRVGDGPGNPGVGVLNLEFSLFGPDGAARPYRYEAVAGEVTQRTLAAVIDAAIAAHAAAIDKQIMAAAAPRASPERANALSSVPSSAAPTSPAPVLVLSGRENVSPGAPATGR